MLDVRCLAGKRGTSWLFSGLDLEVRPGDALLLQGPNGSGKSTFLEVLAGVGLASSGEVRLHGRLVRSWPQWKRELLAPLVDQHPVVNLDVPCIENLVDSLLLPGWWYWWRSSRRRVRREATREAGELLAATGLLATAERLTWELSYGQRRLLTLVRAMRSLPDGRPRLLLLDEPFAGLRVDRARILIELLNERLRLGWAIVVAEHLPVVRRLEISDELAFPALRA